MKRLFIKLVLVCLPILCMPFLMVFYTKYLTHKIDWKLPQEKHILFMGASHIQEGIDDSLTPNAINLGASSERYMFTYIKLQNILKNNSHIDTVFLQCAPTDLFEHADDKYFKDNEMSYFFRRYYPFFNIEQWYMYHNKIKCSLRNIINVEYISKYVVDGLDYTFFRTPASEANRDNVTINLDSVYFKPVSGNYGNNINYYYLNRIIKLCESNGIQLFFLYCPVYKPEYYYNQEYYYSAYHENFKEIELLDYSHYPMNVNERKDAHHLNNRGAKRFTLILKERFGW